MTDIREDAREPLQLLRERLCNNEEGWRALCQIMPMLAAAPPPAAARGDVRGLVDELRKLCSWKHLMSYNEAYFGEPEGELKSVVYAIGRHLPSLAAEGVQAGEVEQRAREFDLAVLDDAAETLDRLGDGSAGLRAARARIASALSQQPEARGVVDDDSRARVQDAIAAALGATALDCLRVWEAWQVGTMGPDDFSVIVDDSDRLAEITDAAIAEMQGEAMTIVRKLAALRDGLDNSNSSAEELAARLAHRAATLTGERNG